MTGIANVLDGGLYDKGSSQSVGSYMEVNNVLDNKDNMIVVRVSPYERQLAEAVTLRRKATISQRYSLSQLVRDSIIQTVREELEEE
jgi:hypothetical protein